MSEHQPAIVVPEEALVRLREARYVFMLTGAGVSAESGIPTFRAPGTGLWSQYRLEDFATPSAWRRDPSLVWSWYTHRRRLARRARPNPAHLGLAQLERWLAARGASSLIATQNVDGLHQRAGSSDVIELHGSLFRFRCVDEGVSIAWEDPEDDDQAALERLEQGERLQPPPCPRCSSALRPDVVWFEEPLPIGPWTQAHEAAERCDVCIVVGTSARVYPAANLPGSALRHGAYLIEINPEVTGMTGRAHWAAQASAGLALPALLSALGETLTS
ncbi:MAG TPA: NAD-dependent deacylase [Ktedonobacterales bacterium]|nr:NAD-dependent deacylase [Ktedonobacterales bacterium]